MSFTSETAWLLYQYSLLIMLMALKVFPLLCWIRVMKVDFGSQRDICTSVFSVVLESRHRISCQPEGQQMRICVGAGEVLNECILLTHSSPFPIQMLRRYQWLTLGWNQGCRNYQLCTASSSPQWWQAETALLRDVLQRLGALPPPAEYNKPVSCSLKGILINESSFQAVSVSIRVHGQPDPSFSVHLSVLLSSPHCPSLDSSKATQIVAMILYLKFSLCLLSWAWACDHSVCAF